MIDSIYNPVKDIGYSIEYTRVGDITNYEKLTLNIETNGTISPGEAVKQTVQIIMDHFSVISGAANEMVLDMPMPVVAKAEESEEEDEEKKVKKAKKVSKKK